MIHSTGAKIIIRLLKEHGIKTVAGLPGATVLPLYDELLNEKITHVLVRHEQAAGFVAQGIARSTELPAVCIATSGPGALNLLTAIADAKADSIPLIAITGQVSTEKIGTDSFQEADVFGLSLPITKHSILVTTALDLLDAIPKAFEIALEGRPGPVLIDIPLNVQEEKVAFNEWPKAIYKKYKISRYETKGTDLEQKIALFSTELQKAKNPLVFVGGGCKSLMGAAVIKDFLKVCKIPVVCTLMGLGVVPDNYEKFCGMIGLYGSSFANEVLKKSDLILALGVRFDNRSMAEKDDLFTNTKILQIDVDAAEIDKLQESYAGIVGDVRSCLPLLTEKLKENASQIENNVQVLPKERDFGQKLLNQIATLFYKTGAKAGFLPKDTIIVTDVGSHQMWVAKGFPFYSANQLLTSGSFGTMGFGLPAAIGASIANPKKKVVLFSGDGSILMNVQELATLSELNLNVTIIVLDNNSLGMVYHLQDGKYCGRHTQTQFKQGTDIAKVAEAFNIPSITCDYKEIETDSERFVDFAFLQKSPRLVRCIIPTEWK